MNQIALAYGVAGLAVAVALATVVGTSTEAEPTFDRPPLAVAAADPAPAPPDGPAEVTYVDERGNPVDPSALRPGRDHRSDDADEHEDGGSDDHRSGRRSSREGDDD